MSRKPPRSPQEKKALSLSKDRRNGYGENDKASRKKIPLRKAKESRRVRHRTNQAIAMLDSADEAGAALVESSARHDLHRVGGWRKAADVPLAEHVASGLQARAARAGRKARQIIIRV